METVGAFDAKTRLSELLDRASRGESFVITKHGRAIARLIPEDGPEPSRVAEAVRRLKGLRGSLRAASVDEILTARDEGRRF